MVRSWILAFDSTQLWIYQGYMEQATVQLVVAKMNTTLKENVVHIARADWGTRIVHYYRSVAHDCFFDQRRLLFNMLKHMITAYVIKCIWFERKTGTISISVLSSSCIRRFESNIRCYRFAFIVAMSSPYLLPILRTRSLVEATSRRYSRFLITR